jgi:2',3'-cyclic-nucleotide 2'-phosphodiesterase (5'-nucleotidase family)
MKRLLPGLLLLALSFSCRTPRPAPLPVDDGKIEIVFLQLNDVYEIAPLEGGKVGGLARVATLREKLRKENHNTITVMAGDFLNPSVLGTLKYEGKNIAGRQMVDVLNVMGLDLATFGNHEFDLKEAELLERLRESRFGWVSSNAGHWQGDSLRRFPSGPDGDSVSPTFILDFADTDGTRLRIGVTAVTLPSTQKPYVRYSNIYRAAEMGYKALENMTDCVIGLTHVSIDEDKEISRRVPGLKLIMGGHEHDHMYHQVGNTYIAKADANAKTVYVHRLRFDKNTRQVDIQSTLVPIDSTLAFEPRTDSVVRKWTGIAARSFREMGFDPDQVLMTTAEPLDGRESSIRNGSTNLTRLVTSAVTATAPQSELTILNSGSIRVDDQLTGAITQYDVLRTLPFGGKLVEAEMTGHLLDSVLTVGRRNKGSGGYLQVDRATFDESTKRWTLGGKPLNPKKNYRVALPAFLLTGEEKNLGFLQPGKAGLGRVYEPDPADKTDLRNDIRLAIIAYMRAVRK